MKSGLGSNMSEKIIRRFTFFGFIFGLMFPMIALGIDLYDKGLSFSIVNLIKLHQLTVIHYIIDLAPLVLGFTAWNIGRFVKKAEEANHERLKLELEKSRKYAAFTEKLINGDYNFEIEIGNTKEDDELENSLSALRTSLIQNEEREKRQNWISGGLSKFIQVLRADNITLQDLGDRIISAIVQYLEANQGIIFLSETDHYSGITQLKLLSAYAYEKKKYIDKTIKEGEGLVGTVFSEKSTLYLKEIPEDYVEISSGLGQAKPTSVLIVPLLLNGTVFGVIELASFREFKDYEIEFMERLAENIASTISGIRTSETTKKLLEESQIQTEQLRSQEEEMRQNMEEITATQEEMERKEAEYQRIIEELEMENAELKMRLSDSK